jgi:hypothetical protein
MTSTHRSQIYLLAFGGMFFLVSVLQLVRFFAQPTDIWWTPQALRVPLANASDRVEIYVRDAPLQDAVKAGRVQLVVDGGVTTIAAPDLRLRFNNWDRIRAQNLPVLLSAAFCAGGSGVFLLLGIVGWIPRKPKGQ